MIRCVNPTDPTPAPTPSGGGFCGTGATPVELPEWQKAYMKEAQTFNSISYKVTKDIESQKFWRDLVWADALGKSLETVDHRIRKIALAREGEEEDTGIPSEKDHSRTVRTAMALLFFDYMKEHPQIRKLFTSATPDSPSVPIGWDHFRSRVLTILETDFGDAVFLAAAKAGRPLGPVEKRGMSRDPWWMQYERLERKPNPRLSYWDDATKHDVFTATPSPTYFKGRRDVHQIEIEPWLNKSQLPTVVADEAFVRDIARKQNSGARRCRNPWAMNPQDKAFALKHDIPASVWNDPTFQQELRSYIARHGTYPRSVYRVRVPEGFPRYMSAWGKAPNVLYDAPKHSNKGKRIHHFGEDKGKGKKPWLVSSQEKGPSFLAYVGGEFEADGEWIRY